MKNMIFTFWVVFLHMNINALGSNFVFLWNTLCVIRVMVSEMINHAMATMKNLDEWGVMHDRKGVYLLSWTKAIACQHTLIYRDILDSLPTHCLWWIHTNGGKVTGINKEVMMVLLPVASFGLRVLSLPASVCPCVRVCVSITGLSAR